MDLPIQLISTDFDGTLHAEGETPAVPEAIETCLRHLQARGTQWVVNTGRDLAGVLAALERAHLSIQPDFLVVVEREIFYRQGRHYLGLIDWNQRCQRDHEILFARVRPLVPVLADWINARFTAQVYDDPYSPFCLMARSNADADLILEHVQQFCQTIPGLTVVRNDVWARFSHAAYNKGTALGEILRQVSVGRDQVLAAGDHWNDLPMLSTEFARWLVAPANAVEAVKAAVRRQNGYVSSEPGGLGVARGIAHFLQTLEAAGPFPAVASVGPMD